MMTPSLVRLPKSWKRHLINEFQKDYMIKLKAFLSNQIRSHKKIYPLPKQYFNAFYLTDFEKVQVVILGQDPYHSPGQAHGLCFSVPEGIHPPPSLKNIFKELQHDVKIKPPPHGSLIRWAEQGVFLLNAILTVEANRASSHQNKGWEIFTDEVIRVLNEQKKGLVFMLWGAYAQKKESLISGTKHLILKTSHPSPFSADRGFLGCAHFSQANHYLKSHGRSPIDWNV